MSDPTNLLIFGASARSAAFSALRAGLRPWCADLFADADLRARCATMRIPARRYPGDFIRLIASEVRGPWMYTGALENRPLLIHRLAQFRPLWGTRAPEVEAVRSPRSLAAILGDANIDHPAVFAHAPAVCGARRWLVKPLSGGSERGRAISFWDGQRSPSRSVYFQEYVPGPSCAAVYVGDGKATRLVGVTRQLVGEDWLHARPFAYCGSVGPLDLDAPAVERLKKVGRVLGVRCELKGLFGVDCILSDGMPIPVEVNPRYTASVEVLEHALGAPVMAWHRQVFDRSASVVASASSNERGYVGKGVLFAAADVDFPPDGPWAETLRSEAPVSQLPAFADLPEAGQRIEAGRPVLSFFARGESPQACEEALRLIAADLDRLLFSRP